MNANALPRLLALAIGVALASPVLADGTPAAAAPDAVDAADGAAALEDLRAARKELREVTRRIAEISARIGASEAPRTFAFHYLNEPDRAMIGVVFGEARGDAVALAAVTPGGPADKAGLRAGDRVVAVNGKAVRGGDPASARERVGRLKAGDRVTLTVEREGKRQDLVATAERRESWDWPSFAEGLDPLPPGFERDIQVIVERHAMDAAEAGEIAARAR
ncbi:MAG: PDZ domain-containing protein [Pseudomonadota bacterium]